MVGVGYVDVYESDHPDVYVRRIVLNESSVTKDKFKSFNLVLLGVLVILFLWVLLSHLIIHRGLVFKVLIDFVGYLWLGFLLRCQ